MTLSYELSNLILKAGYPYSIGEKLVKPALQLAASRCATKSVQEKFSMISMSRNTVKRQGNELSSDILQQLLERIYEAPMYGIQLDESTDIEKKAQLIVYVRLANVDSLSFEEHFLCCLEVGVETTGAQIFSVIDNFFTIHNIDWIKCTSVTTDGAGSMMGKTKGVCSRIQQRAPNCVVKHCMIHREALAVKKLSVNCEQPTELEKCLDDVIKSVNLIRANKQSKSCRIFSQICEDMDEEHKTLFLHSEVRWLSKGNVISRFHQLRAPVAAGSSEHVSCVLACNYKN